MNTAEHFNTSTDITISVLDGDDQNPEFQPCILIFQDETSRICTSPVYTVNVTEGEEVSYRTLPQTYETVNTRNIFECDWISCCRALCWIFLLVLFTQRM